MQAQQIKFERIKSGRKGPLPERFSIKQTEFEKNQRPNFFWAVHASKKSNRLSGLYGVQLPWTSKNAVVGTLGAKDKKPKTAEGLHKMIHRRLVTMQKMIKTLGPKGVRKKFPRVMKGSVSKKEVRFHPKTKTKKKVKRGRK